MRALSDTHLVVIVMGIRAGFGMDGARMAPSLPSSIRTVIRVGDAPARFDLCIKLISYCTMLLQVKVILKSHGQASAVGTRLLPD